MRGRIDTNTHTYFFREAAGLHAASAHLAARARRGDRDTRAWSAGCSSGAEPYSLAVLLAERGVRADILATDINPQALAAAGNNQHTQRALRYAEPERLRRWFVSDGEQHALRQEVQQMVRFELHDIENETAPRPVASPAAAGWDVILCRNVLIYLDLEGVGRAVSKFAAALAPDGLLLLGASEWLSSKLQRHAPQLAELDLVNLDGVVGYRRREVSAPRRQPSGARGSVIPPLAAAGPTEAWRLGPRLYAMQRPPAVTDGVPVRPFIAVDRLRVDGDRQLDAGRVEPALALFDEAICIDELHADLHLRRGLALLRLGRSVEAVTALRRSLFLDPTSWPAAMLLGDLVADQDVDAAERFFRQARTCLTASTTGGESLHGALAPFFAGRAAALEAVESRLADLQRASLAATVRRYAHS